VFALAYIHSVNLLNTDSACH